MLGRVTWWGLESGNSPGRVGCGGARMESFGTHTHNTHAARGDRPLVLPPFLESSYREIGARARGVSCAIFECAHKM